MAEPEIAGLEVVEESALKQFDPLAAEGIQIGQEAKAIVIANDADLSAANTIKKRANAYSKNVKDMRMGLSRPIDKVKDALITRERELLQPVEDGKKVLGDNILAYEEEQERIRREEEKRIDDIANEILGHYKPGMTKSQVEAAKDRGRRYIQELPPADAAQHRIKAALLNLSNRLQERLQDIDVEEQRAKKKKLDVDQAAIDRQREQNAAREAEIAEEQRQADAEAARLERSRPKSNIVEQTEVEVISAALVPREYCSPDLVKIRAAVKSGVAEIAGVQITKSKKVR